MAFRYSKGSAASAATGNPTLDMLIGGMGNRESGMNFRAVGPATRNGDRAYGFSQVMGTNVGPWTQEVLGVRMSPQQYLNNPEAQYAITSAKLGGYLSQYGNPQDALSMWHSGRPMARSTQANDGFVNTHDYVNQIMDKMDPRRSYMASGSPQGAAGSPMQLPGATLAGDAQGSPQGSLGPQSVSLGDEEQQPLNNIGSTLANMGASIASLDRGGTGIASLNASNVARNLAAQEALNKKDNKWSFAGFTPNKTGALFSNGNQTVVRPLGAYGGEDNKLQYRGIDSDEKGNRFDTFTDANGNLIRKPTEMVDPNVKQRTPMDPDALDLMTDGFLKGDPQVMTRLSADDKKEILGHAARQIKAAGGQNVSYDEIMSNKAKFAGMLADERKRSTAEADFDRSSSKFYADAKTALENSDKVERLGAKAWNMVGQFTTDQLQKQGAPELASFRESTEALSRAYASALTQTGVTNQVAEEKARDLLSTIQSKETYESVVKTMTSTVQRAGQSMRALHENQQDRNAGRTPRHKEYSEEKSMDELLGLTGKGSAKATNTSSPSQAHVDGLRAHPEMRDQFDAKFGPGAAAKILGN